MRQNTLGSTDLLVSELCLGTMTYGTQTPEDDAHRQMDMALDHGINIFDTAEMYPVNPITSDRLGDSERIVGNWLARSGRRDDVIVATKIAGEGMRLIRDGAPISAQTIRTAIEGSLSRLQTDHVDLYQLHWPNRGSYMFRQNWSFDPTGQDPSKTRSGMQDVLRAMQELCREGKVRHFGLSNESAWGTSQWLRISEDNGWPRVQAIQNEYSLLCRMFDTDLGELAHNERVGLLAYSPLAAGILTGKYQDGNVPAGSRMSINPNLNGRANERVWKAVDEYLGLAKRYGIDLPHMSLAWCGTRHFMASAIFGATTSEQLRYLLKSIDISLDEECIREIDEINRRNPMPF